MQPEASESTERSPEPIAPEEDEDEMALVGLLRSEVQLADGVVIAGLLTIDEIISAALGVADEVPDGEAMGCAMLDALYCKRIRGRSRCSRGVALRCFTLALEGSSHAHKLVRSTQLFAYKQTSIADFFSK